MELLTGVKAGNLDAGGSYPVGTINYLVDQRLHEFAIALIKRPIRRTLKNAPASSQRRSR